MKKFLLATAAGVMMFAGAASAADMPARMATKAPVMAPMFNWSGVYIGIHGGYGSIDDSGFGGGDQDGGFGGGQIGINWQAPGSNWVFGLELDSAFADISTSAGGVSSETDYLGSFRGRIGYAWGPTMIYATGGIGWINNEISAGAFGTDRNTHFGYAVGGGIEHAINAGPWSVKLEYVFYGLDSENYTFAAPVGTISSGDVDLHTVKLGLNYRFGAGWGRW